MDRAEYLLVCLAEECAEVGHAVGKALRFGLTSYSPGNYGPRNDDLIVRELHDVFAVLELLTESGVLDRGYYGEAIKEKKKMVERFLSHAEKLDAARRGT